MTRQRAATSRVSESAVIESLIAFRCSPIHSTSRPANPLGTFSLADSTPEEPARSELARRLRFLRRRAGLLSLSVGDIVARSARQRRRPDLRSPGRLSGCDILIRAPLEAMRDLGFPLKGPGYLDFARLGAQIGRRGPDLDRRLHPALRERQELPEETIVATRVSLPVGPFLRLAMTPRSQASNSRASG